MSVRCEVVDGVAIITLDRPEVLNAIDKPTAEALSDALDEVDSRSDVTVGVLASSGKVFCAGMDLKAFHATGDLPITSRRGGMGIVERPSAKPMIAAVQGPALGGGFEVALACDLIVAEEGALFGLPEVRHGLIPAGGGLLRLPGRIPRSMALEMILTGDVIDAGRAAALGLVNRLVSTGKALEEATALAARIASNAPLSVRTAKRVFDESVDWPKDEAFERQAPLTDPVLASADAAEGARAFAEKRRAVWTGK